MEKQAKLFTYSKIVEQLSKIKDFKHPQLQYEQYKTPTDLAA